jgi:Mg/Co/Ni transporter MgtE
LSQPPSEPPKEAQPAVDPPKKRVVVITDPSCEACGPFLEQLKDQKVKDAIKAATEVDGVEVLNLQESDLAVNIVSSLDSYAVPMIAVLKKSDDGKTEACELTDELKPKKCAELKELPP